MILQTIRTEDTVRVGLDSSGSGKGPLLAAMNSVVELGAVRSVRQTAGTDSSISGQCSVPCAVRSASDWFQNVWQ